MRLYLLLATFGIAFGLAFQGGTAGSTARADGDNIEVVESAVESRFPEGIRFSLTARSPVEIEEIRVFFRKVHATQGSTYRSLEFQPGKLVNGEYLLRSSGAGHFPPGTRIAFRFEVWDKAGNVHRTPDQQFVYTDTRFDWLSKSSGLITVDYYGKDAESQAAAVLAAAKEALEKMGPVLGIRPTEPLRIVSYTNYLDMVPALPFRSRATSEQLRTEGIAFVEERVLLVHSLDATAKGTAAHEFTHLLVAEATRPAHDDVPSWLNEGLAEYGNIAPTPGFAQALQRGIATDRVKPLWFQRTFLGTPDDIIIAYGQAASVVDYMISQYGEAKMAQLMAALAEGLDTDAALEIVYGFGQRGLDARWRSFLGLDPLPSPDNPGRLPPEMKTPAPTRTPALEPAATLQPTASTEPTPAAVLEDDGQGNQSPGCGAGPGHAAGAELATLALLAGPIAALAWRNTRRRR